MSFATAEKNITAGRPFDLGVLPSALDDGLAASPRRDVVVVGGGLSTAGRDLVDDLRPLD